jgi:general secretion pathway protein A
MYSQFFNLTKAPFSIAPDPRYLFMSDRHREALAHLLYGVGSGGGFVVLTGEIGAGKTTICRCFLRQVPVNCNVAYIVNPKLTVIELLETICSEFRVACSHDNATVATAKNYIDALTQYLIATYAKDRNNVLIIDEAQNLSSDVLEQLRLLTNLETNERKLLQIILIGQPELRIMLAQPELEQFAQRVTARYHLDALSAVETAGYIAHRLTVAGLTSESPFKPQSIAQIHQFTQGVPRRINLLCDRALLGAYSENKYEVDASIVTKAAAEIFGHSGVSIPVRTARWHYGVWGMIAGATVAGAAFWIMLNGLQWKGSAMESSASNGATTASVGKASAASEIRGADFNKSPAPSFPGTPADTTHAANPPLSSADANPWDMNDPSNTGLRDRNNAIRELAQLWGLPLKDRLPCLTSQEKNLHCYISNSTGLAEIRLLNRPAILSLHDSTGKIYYALLTAMTPTHAMLRIDGVTQTMSVGTLARHFKGELVTFWRAPYTYRELVGLGYFGEEANWISTQLAKINGVKKMNIDQRFDQEMVRQVRKFQLAQGIRADGVVGPKTFMQLNRVAGIEEPHLHSISALASAPSKE